MTPRVSTPSANQAESLATAPQGTAMQTSHKYVPNQNLLSPNATNTIESGEAEQS